MFGSYLNVEFLVVTALAATIGDVILRQLHADEVAVVVHLVRVVIVVGIVLLDQFAVALGREHTGVRLQSLNATHGYSASIVAVKLMDSLGRLNEFHSIVSFRVESGSYVADSTTTSIRLLLRRRCSLDIGEYGLGLYASGEANPRVALLSDDPLHYANHRAAVPTAYSTSFRPNHHSFTSCALII